MSNPLITPRDLADLVIDAARKRGVDATASLRAEDILAVLADAGQRAVSAAVQRGAGDLIRGLADAAARRVEGQR